MLNSDEKIASRKVISGVSCNDSRGRTFFVSSVDVKERNYRVERHKEETVVLKEEWERKRAMMDRNETVFI